MSFEVFLELTPKEFYKSLQEKERHEEDIVIAQIRTICETLRTQTLHLLNVQLPKGKKIRNLKQLMHFSWERAPQPAQTMEQMKAVMKAIAKGMANKKSKKDGKKDRKRIGRKS